MLAEWLERFWSRCPVYLQELGCLREMLGIRRRWRQFHSAWLPHCLRSRSFLLQAIQQCSSRRKALILGSGWLHDVPLPELANSFAEVLLVDLFHPHLTRRHARRFPNVRLLEADVTQTLQQVWRAGWDPLPRLPRARPSLFTDFNDLDWSVSLNLLSQLPCMAERYLRQSGHYPDAEILAYCQDLLSAHLDYLQRLPGVVSLITDVEVRTVDSSGEEISCKNTLYGLPFPYPAQSWDWTLVPRLSDRPDHAQVLTLRAVANVKPFASAAPA